MEKMIQLQNSLRLHISCNATLTLSERPKEQVDSQGQSTAVFKALPCWLYYCYRGAEGVTSV